MSNGHTQIFIIYYLILKGRRGGGGGDTLDKIDTLDTFDTLDTLETILQDLIPFISKLSLTDARTDMSESYMGLRPSK
jgi:hypothetical protein